MENLTINLKDSDCAATIIYHKILSYGIYYFSNPSIAEWFIQQHKNNGFETYLVKNSWEEKSSDMQ